MLDNPPYAAEGQQAAAESQQAAAESQQLYHALFNRPIPPIVAERFAEGSRRLEANFPPDEVAAYRAALVSGLDLEALELAGRYTRRLPLLTRKFRLMVYLAETVPQNQALFISKRDNLPGALVRVVAVTLRTVWLMVKGLSQLRQLPQGGSR